MNILNLTYNLTESLNLNANCCNEFSLCILHEMPLKCHLNARLNITMILQGNYRNRIIII